MSRLTLSASTRAAITVESRLSGRSGHMANTQPPCDAFFFTLVVEQGEHDVSATLKLPSLDLRYSITLERNASTGSRLCQWIEEAINGEPISVPAWDDAAQPPSTTDMDRVLQQAIENGAGTYALLIDGVAIELELREWHSCNCLVARLHIADDDPDALLAVALPQTPRAALLRLREVANQLATGYHNAHRAA